MGLGSENGGDDDEDRVEKAGMVGLRNRANNSGTIMHTDSFKTVGNSNVKFASVQHMHWYYCKYVIAC